MQLHINTETTLRALAWVALREWLAADDFKPVARLSKVWASTSIGQEIERRRKRHWQWWKGGDGRGEELRDLYRQIPEVWMREGWVTYEQHKVGRPRRATHPPETVMKALRIYRDGNQGSVTDKSFQWAASILGENTARYESQLITVSDSINLELLGEIGDENIDGLTRAELAETVGLPNTYTNRLVRWMLTTGEWKEVQELREGKKERRLRRVVP
jgi:hypothetical protein